MQMPKSLATKPCGNLILINLKSNIRVLADALKQLVNDLAQAASLLEDDLLVMEAFPPDVSRISQQEDVPAER